MKETEVKSKETVGEQKPEEKYRRSKRLLKSKETEELDRPKRSGASYYIFKKWVHI